MLRKATIAALTMAAVGGAGLPLMTASAAETGSISGVAFEDVDRDGVLDAGEPVWADQLLYLYDASGSYLRNVRTDPSGRYAFAALPTGTYTVAYSATSWNPLRTSWTPTTLPGQRPSSTVSVGGSTVVDFGWRTISWSTELGTPVSRAVSAKGVAVESYNDAVTAQQVAAALDGGLLIGSEASSTTVRVAYGSVDQTVSSSSYDGTRYSGFSASVYVTWASWLDRGAFTLFHEYGHAWSGYYATIVNGDNGLTGYLRARGLEGDSRVDSAYGWDRNELVAEDYRQLFGDAAGRAQAQANAELPSAASVAGLEDYLRTTFRTSSTTSSATTQPAQPAPTISRLQMSRVSKSGTASFDLSIASTVSLRITTSAGVLVKTLLSSAPAAAGGVSAVWDRTNMNGQRVKAGTYLLVASATSSGGSSSDQVSFSVS